jgi:hypothetical protein
VNSQMSRIDDAFQETRDVCFGRFLITVPKQSYVIYGPAYIPFLTQYYEGAASKVDELVSKRLVEIQDERVFSEGDLKRDDSMVGRSLKGSIEKQIIVFGVGRGSGSSYLIESFLPLGNDLFVQEARSLGNRGDYSMKVQQLNVYAQLFELRDEQEIPHGTGICIEGGFVRDAGSSVVESVSLGIRLLEFPDVHFSISMTKKDTIVESDALEPRIRQAQELAARQGRSDWYSRIKTLRKGERAFNGWHGYEILARKPAQGHENAGHEFLFVSQGEPKSIYRPVLDVELLTGVEDNKPGATTPSLKDDEAVALWDRLTNSVRVREIKH